MTDAKATICYLNGLSLNTINEVEKILRSLPQKGNRCEVQSSKPLNGGVGERGTADVIASKSLQIRDEVKPLSLSPPVSRNSRKTRQPKIVSEPESATNSSTCSTSSRSSVCSVKKTPDSKFQCKLLTDQVRVSPIIGCTGVILEIDVEVTVPGKETKKKFKLEIECPDFVPARIKIGNKWKNIV